MSGAKANELQVKSDPHAPVPPYYVKGLALGIPAYLIGIHLWTWVFTVGVFPGGDADFRSFYAAGHMVRSGKGVLLISILITLSRFIESEATGDKRGRLMTRVAAVTFIAPVCESFIPGHFFWVSLPVCTLLVLLIQCFRQGVVDTATLSCVASRVPAISDVISFTGSA